MIVTEMFGVGDNKSRRAEVHRQAYDGWYYVKFFENNEHRRTEVLKDKSVHYAEDAADNWCCGIIKE